MFSQDDVSRLQDYLSDKAYSDYGKPEILVDRFHLQQMLDMVKEYKILQKNLDASYERIQKLMDRPYTGEYG